MKNNNLLAAMVIIGLIAVLWIVSDTIIKLNGCG